MGEDAPRRDSRSFSLVPGARSRATGTRSVRRATTTGEVTGNHPSIHPSIIEPRRARCLATPGRRDADRRVNPRCTPRFLSSPRRTSRTRRRRNRRRTPRGEDARRTDRRRVRETRATPRTTTWWRSGERRGDDDRSRYSSVKIPASATMNDDERRSANAVYALDSRSIPQP